MQSWPLIILHCTYFRNLSIFPSFRYQRSISPVSSYQRPLNQNWYFIVAYGTQVTGGGQILHYFDYDCR